jgi:hypothetical protein
MSPTPQASNVGYLSSQLYQPAAAPVKRVEPDLREQIARHLAAQRGSGGDSAHSDAAAAAVTAADAAAIRVQMQMQAQQQQPTSHWQAAAQSLRRSLDSGNRRSLEVSRSPSSGSTAAVAISADSAVGKSSSSKSPTRRAELSRKQLKAVRKMFPITTPSLKPAAVLQVRSTLGQLHSLQHIRCGLPHLDDDD